MASLFKTANHGSFETNAATGTISVTTPSAAIGDLMVWHQYVAGGSGTGPQTGWTPCARSVYVIGHQGWTGSAYWRVVDGTEAGSYDITGSTVGIGIISVWSNPSGITPQSQTEDQNIATGTCASNHRDSGTGTHSYPMGPTSGTGTANYPQPRNALGIVQFDVTELTDHNASVPQSSILAFSVTGPTGITQVASYGFRPNPSTNLNPGSPMQLSIYEVYEDATPEITTITNSITVDGGDIAGFNDLMTDSFLWYPNLVSQDAVMGDAWGFILG